MFEQFHSTVSHLQRAAHLLSKGLEAVQEPRPEVLEQRPVDLLQAVFGAGVHADVQLGDWHQAPGWENKEKTLLYKQDKTGVFQLRVFLKVQCLNLDLIFQDFHVYFYTLDL